MSKFDAAEAISALEYDFTTIKGPDSEPCEGKGTIPEPTRGLVVKAFGRLREAASESGVTEIADAKSPEALLDALTEESIEKMGDVMLDVMAELCQGSPTREQIAALPIRPQNAFFGWLFGQVGDPTQLNGASRG